jgi:predicted O-methyltransferase YrrM
VQHASRFSYQRLLQGGLRRTFPIWERLGFHITPNHYSQPIPDTRRLGSRPWDRPSALVGLEMNAAGQLSLMDLWALRYRAEYERFPVRGTARPDEYFLANSMFIGVDAQALHCMVRSLRPRRILEIGAGFSTLVSGRALLENQRETGVAGELVAIDPHPRDFLRRGVAGLSKLITTPLQDLPLSFFEELGENDVLFIDSSHVLAIGSDVQYEILEILPRLRRGVVVHLHDIFLPDEYPRTWVLKNCWFWNEQYLLQAFLCFNNAFEVLWAGAYLHREHPLQLQAAFPWSRVDTRRPGSFWMRKTR